MKITNSDIIKSGERELIDSIIGDLDWDTIEEIVKNRHKLNIQDDVEYRQGDIIVHDNQVAYKLDFDVKMTLSVVFDRAGNYLSLATSEDTDATSEATEAMETANESPTDMDETDAVESSLDAGEFNTDGSESRTETDSPEPFVSDEIPTANPDNAPKENFSKMASHIAEMISDINDD